jgi:disulfide bond formation protein DsbB
MGNALPIADDRIPIVAGIAGAVVALLVGESTLSVRHAIAALAAGTSVAVFLAPWTAEMAGITSPNTIAACAFFSGLTGLQIAKLLLQYGPRAAVTAAAARLGWRLPTDEQRGDHGQ